MINADEFIKLSRELHKQGWDDFYALPEYVAKFLEDINPQMPENCEVQPWTINRAVSIWKNGQQVGAISYETLECSNLLEHIKERIHTMVR